MDLIPRWPWPPCMRSTCLTWRTLLMARHYWPVENQELTLTDWLVNYLMCIFYKVNFKHVGNQYFLLFVFRKDVDKQCLVFSTLHFLSFVANTGMRKLCGNTDLHFTFEWSWHLTIEPDRSLSQLSVQLPIVKIGPLLRMLKPLCESMLGVGYKILC